MSTDPKVIAVAMALKQSLERNASAGASINAHPNAFFLNVNGPVDLYKMAAAALARAKSYERSTAAAFEAAVKQLGDKLEIEFKAGAVSIQDAIARLKAKRGELIAPEGVVEETVARRAAQVGVNETFPRV